MYYDVRKKSFVKETFIYVGPFRFGFAKAWRLGFGESYPELVLINREGETVHTIIDKNEYRNTMSQFR